MEQPEKDPHAYIDGITGLKTTHPQVPLFYYTCDKGIADLISIMNYCGIHTINSCQDNRGNHGNVPRVWVEILGQDLSCSWRCSTGPARPTKRRASAAG